MGGSRWIIWVSTALKGFFMMVRSVGLVVFVVVSLLTSDFSISQAYARKRVENPPAVAATPEPSSSAVQPTPQATPSSKLRNNGAQEAPSTNSATGDDTNTAPTSSKIVEASDRSQVDSKWRLVGVIGAGSLSPQGEGSGNTLETDFESGIGVGLGVLANYRPNETIGMDFGLKVLSLSRDAKYADLDLTLTYLALPFEMRFNVLKIRERSSMFIKAGLTYLILLTAKVQERNWYSSDSNDDDDDDWDWDLFPSPAPKADYRASFHKTDWLASLGIGTDLLLHQAKNGFNISLMPEIVYSRGLTTISKDGEFNGDVHNEGVMVNVPVAFGF